MGRAPLATQPASRQHRLGEQPRPDRSRHIRADSATQSARVRADRCRDTGHWRRMRHRRDRGGQPGLLPAVVWRGRADGRRRRCGVALQHGQAGQAAAGARPARFIVGSSAWVRLARGLVTPAIGRAPRHLPWSKLLQVPARRLFRAMMATANGRKVAPAGPAAPVEGHRVIKVGPNGWPSAAGKATGPLADVDQVPQCDRRLVTSRLVRVAAVVDLQQVELAPQPGNPADHRLIG